MKKLIWLIDISLDGFMSGPNGELDWVANDMDDEMWRDVNDLLATVDSALFGRVTFQNFESYWPHVSPEPAGSKHESDFSRWIEATPKYVASQTLGSLQWKNSTLLKGDVAPAIAKIKQQPGKHLLMFGSCNLAASLWNAGSIDEMRIRVHPVVLRAGRPAFHDKSDPHRLQLLESKLFHSGMVGLRYLPA